MLLLELLMLIKDVIPLIIDKGAYFIYTIEFGHKTNCLLRVCIYVCVCVFVCV